MADQKWRKPYGNFLKTSVIDIEFLNLVCSLNIIIEHEEIRFENDQVKKNNLLYWKHYIEKLASERVF